MGGGYVLGRYQEFSPDLELADVVRCLWRYSPLSESYGAIQQRHLVLPDPGVDLAFFCRRDSTGRCEDPALLFLGSVHQPREFVPHDDLEIVAAKFHPDAVLPVLKIRPGEHLNVLASLEDLNGEFRQRTPYSHSLYP